MATTNLVQIEKDEEIKQRLEAERMRLRKIAGLDQPNHFHRPVERAFTAEERNQVTILFGGFTWKHEDLIRAVFQGCGYRCEKLARPERRRVPDRQGIRQQRPVQSHLFHRWQPGAISPVPGRRRHSAQADSGQLCLLHCRLVRPCRFGMYEAEYRFALKNAGFDGFRVLLFKDSDGIKAASGEPGLKFTIDFGFGMLNAMHMGDVINDMIYQVRPFEVNEGRN